MSKIQIIFLNLQYKNIFKEKALGTFSTNFAVGNLQLSIEKLQLLPPTYFNPQRCCSESAAADLNRFL